MEKSYLYDYDEAAALVGLAPTSIRDYCFRGTYGLQRGRDFIKVRYKHGRMRREGIRLTRPGIERLLLRHTNGVEPMA